MSPVHTEVLSYRSIIVSFCEFVTNRLTPAQHICSPFAFIKCRWGPKFFIMVSINNNGPFFNATSDRSGITKKKRKRKKRIEHTHGGVWVELETSLVGTSLQCCNTEVVYYYVTQEVNWKGGYHPAETTHIGFWCWCQVLSSRSYSYCCNKSVCYRMNEYIKCTSCTAVAAISSWSVSHSWIEWWDDHRPYSVISHMV